MSDLPAATLPGTRPGKLLLAIPSKGRLMEETVAAMARAGLTLRASGNERGYRREIVGEDDSVALAEAWGALQRACAAVDEEAVQDEYDSLLIGVGKAPVPPYVGAYAEKTGPESLLVELRAYLAARGLGRKDSVTEPEDHVAALCELMRHLISVQQAGIEDQRECYHRFIYPGAVRFCDALLAAESANFYKAVARFARAFFELERTAFEMQ